MTKKLTASVLVMSLMMPAVSMATDLTPNYNGSLNTLVQRLDKYRTRGKESVDDMKGLSQVDAIGENYRVLFVGGFNDILGNIGTGTTDQMSLYFADQLKTMDEVNVSARIVSVDAAKDEKSSLDLLEKEIRRSYSGGILGGNKKVIVVTHSRAGLDMLQLLLKAQSSSASNYFKVNVKDMIGGWVSIQTPYLGTPLANAIDDGTKEINNENIGQLVELLASFKQTEKHAKTLKDAQPMIMKLKEVFTHLRSDVLTQAYGARSADIARLEATMPFKILSVATYQSKNTNFSELEKEFMEAKVRVLINKALVTLETAKDKEVRATAKNALAAGMAAQAFVNELKEIDDPMLEDKLMQTLFTQSGKLLQSIPKMPNLSMAKIEAPNCYLAPTRNWLESKGEGLNDGFSSFNGQKIIGDVVEVPQLDHFETVMGIHGLVGGQQFTDKLNSPRFRKVGIVALLLTVLGEKL